MSKTNPSVDGYIRKNKKWQDELTQLRAIVLECDLTEEIKWRSPCYTFQSNNVVLLGAFNDYCTISFPKGALLKDAKGILEKPGENTQAARVVRFTDVAQIAKVESTLKKFIIEAIEIEKAGRKVEFKKSAEPTPDELQAKFDEDPEFKKAFEALTPGRQRAYILHFAGAKQSKTRAARIEKYMPLIFDGKGINDDYMQSKKRKAK